MTAPPRRLADAGVASPEHDAAALLAHVLGTTRSRLPLVDEVPRRRRGGVRGAAGPPGRPRAAAAPHRHDLVPPRRPRRRAGGLRAAPRDRAARRLGGRAGRAAGRTARGRPRHRLRRHRQGRRRRGAARPGGGGRARPGRPRLGRSQPRRHRRRAARGVARRRPARASTAPSTSSSPTRPTCRWRPGSRWRPRPATTTRTWPCSPAPTASTRSAPSRSAPPGCCGPGEWSASSTPTSQGEAAPAVFAATGRWRDVRDHPDLAGRPRFLTARRVDPSGMR